MDSPLKGPVIRKTLPFYVAVILCIYVDALGTRGSKSLTDIILFSRNTPAPEAGLRFNIKTVFSGMGISITQIRRSWEHVIFIMGIHILWRRYLCMEMGSKRLNNLSRKGIIWIGSKDVLAVYILRITQSCHMKHVYGCEVNIKNIGLGSM